MMAIFKREFRAYMNGVVGPAIIALILLAAGVLIAVVDILLGAAHVEYAFNYLQFALIVAAPVLAMRAFADEKRYRVDRLLYSLPIKLSSVVLGKYFAMLAVFGIACGVLALYPIALRTQGMAELVVSYTSLIAFFLLGAALLAFCLLWTSLIENQVVSVLLAIGAVVLLFLPDVLVTFAPVSGRFARFLMSASFFSRYSAVCSGVFELETVVFDISFAALFLFLTVQVMERKRRR